MYPKRKFYKSGENEKSNLKIVYFEGKYGNKKMNDALQSVLLNILIRNKNIIGFSYIIGGIMSWVRIWVPLVSSTKDRISFLNSIEMR